MLKISRILLFTIVLLAMFVQCVVAQDEDTSSAPDEATLRLKFVFGGARPELALLNGAGDPFCAQCAIPDERLVVGPNKELKNVALIWDERRNKDVPKKEFAKAAQRVEMEFRNCRLNPHIAVARVGQEVVVQNRDRTGHNADFSFFANPANGMLVPVGQPRIVKLTVSEPAPIPVGCNIHPWERAFLIVKEHPFVGVSNTEGVVEIDGLPVGNQWFQIWHESSIKNFQHVVWDGKTRELTKGRIEIKLEAGVNELGVIQLDAEQFQLPAK